MIKQFQAAAAVHKDSSEVKSVDDWVYDQCGESTMTDTSGMVPAIEGDRIGGPWVELWGDWLQRTYVPERTLPLPLGDVGCVYHVHRPHLWGKPFCPLLFGAGSLHRHCYVAPYLCFRQLTCRPA